MCDVIEKSLCRGKYTLLDEIGKIDKLDGKSFADGKGGSYVLGQEKKDSFIMPGMKQTVSKQCLTGEIGICDDMVPQGICCFGGYIFVSAYCMSKLYNAVIYVLDVNSKAYITTLIMHKHCHAGGLICGEGQLWVADTGAEDTGYLFYFDFGQIREAIKATLKDDKVTAIDMSSFERGAVKLGKGNKASFITNYKGKICVGEYMKNVDNVGRLGLYDPKELLDGIADRTELMTIPGNANGVLFHQAGDKEYALVTANYGKKANSLVHVYEVTEVDGKLVFTATKVMEMPCMIEEGFSYGLYTYFVFESCAKPYRSFGGGKKPAKDIAGRVCGFYSKFIFE